LAGQKKSYKGIILTRFLRLYAIDLGIATGLVAGFVLFIAPNWQAWRGVGGADSLLSPLSHLLIGYRETFVGSLIGLAYGFIGGFLIGYFVARMYNWFAGRRESARKNHL
jgi:hypothetical protein